MPKNRIKESSTRETTASARNSPRHTLSRMTSNCRKGDGWRFVFDGSDGEELAAKGGGGPVTGVTGGGATGNSGGALPVWALSLDDSVFGSGGMARAVADYNSFLKASFSPGAPVRRAA